MGDTVQGTWEVTHQTKSDRAYLVGMMLRGILSNILIVWLNKNDITYVYKWWYAR
jgi:hypothetical protein